MSRVVIKTENESQVVYVDGKKVASFCHYGDDYAYTNAKARAAKERTKLNREDD